jgi:CDP-diacylglycerol--serine O-phosphatidyltransferase
MKDKETMKKGIYILPSIFTLGNIFCGFYAIISALNRHFQAASIAILVAGIFDALDGRVARLTNSCSRFGVEFDSLADLISFGMAPGILIYIWALMPFGRIGWIASFLFVVCGALRLARFNCQVTTSESKSFTGLPIPAAAGTLASFVILSRLFEVPQDIKPIVIAGLAYVLAFLMVSTIRYRSLKQVNLKEKKPFHALVMITLLLLVVAAEPRVMFFLIFLGYVISGPAEILLVHAKVLNPHTVAKRYRSRILKGEKGEQG